MCTFFLVSTCVNQNFYKVSLEERIDLLFCSRIQGISLLYCIRACVLANLIFDNLSYNISLLRMHCTCICLILLWLNKANILSFAWILEEHTINIQIQVSPSQVLFRLQLLVIDSLMYPKLA